MKEQVDSNRRQLLQTVAAIFDDPAVADEFALTTGILQQPVDGLMATNNGATSSFARLLTPTWSIAMDTGYR